MYKIFKTIKFLVIFYKSVDDCYGIVCPSSWYVVLDKYNSSSSQERDLHICNSQLSCLLVVSVHFPKLSPNRL